jgi:hypothetical protein
MSTPHNSTIRNAHSPARVHPLQFSLEIARPIRSALVDRLVSTVVIQREGPGLIVLLDKFVVVLVFVEEV